MQELILIAIAAAAVGVPLLAVVVFVKTRAKAREAKLAGPWGELARRWSGTFTERRVFCDRGDHQLSLEMVLVSVVQALQSPYYPDGGTFTKARIALDPRAPARIADGPGALVEKSDVAEYLPAVKALPPVARLVLGPYEAVIVLPGVVTELGLLQTSFEALDGIRDHVLATSPIHVAA